MVRAIDFDTNIFPQGGFHLLAIHELRRNPNFKGLAPESLRDISKYHHFRPLTQPDKILNIEKDEAIFNYNILDSIDQDPVKGRNIL